MFATTHDIDLRLDDILLAHHNSFEPGRAYSIYKSRRNMDGLVFVIGGTAEYQYQDGENLRVGAGEVVYIPAASAYTVQSCGIEPFDHITINFTLCKTGCVPDVLEQLILSNKIITIYPNSAATHQSLFVSIVDCWDKKMVGYKLQCRSMLYELLRMFFLEHLKYHLNSNDDAKVRPAKQYMDREYAKNISISQLAKMCYMSQTNFRRLFVMVYKVAPIEYLLRIRVARACELFNTRLYSVSEISMMVGFNDPNYFCRVFKRITGMTPSKYKKSV
ncbi:MAG: helix-turn-helix domain-containing protein [Christensenellales bacterium]|jgi:AraC-like DNA-binding protein